MDDEEIIKPIIKTKQKKIEKCCDICGNNYTQISRKEIKCQFCDFSCCKNCIIRFNEDKPDPYCMNTSCNKIFSDEFIYTNFGSTTYSNYMSKSLNLMFQREQSMLPQTVNFLETQKRIEERNSLVRTINVIANDIIDNCRKLSSLRLQLNDKLKILERVPLHNTRGSGNIAYNTKIVEKLQDDILEMQNRIDKDDEKRIMLEDRLISYNDVADNKQSIQFIPTVPCIKDNCRGWLNNLYKCTICKIEVCKKCHEPFSETHKCNPETVKSISLIIKESKNCPNCKVRISRIEGCNQMWCVYCNTAFDYQTGEIIKGKIHNPHYFKWLSSGKKEGLFNKAKDTDTQANQVISECNMDTISVRLVNLKNAGIERNIFTYEDTKNMLNIINIFRLVIELREHPVYVLNIQDPFEHYKPLRLKYLNNDISKDKWKTIFIKDFKSNKLKVQIKELIELYCAVVIDCINIILEEKSIQKVGQLLPSIISQIENIRSYVNKQSYEITIRYNYTNFYIINKDYKLDKQRIDDIKHTNETIDIESIDSILMAKEELFDETELQYLNFYKKVLAIKTFESFFELCNSNDCIEISNYDFMISKRIKAKKRIAIIETIINALKKSNSIFEFLKYDNIYEPYSVNYYDLKVTAPIIILMFMSKGILLFLDSAKIDYDFYNFNKANQRIMVGEKKYLLQNMLLYELSKNEITTEYMYIWIKKIYSYKNHIYNHNAYLTFRNGHRSIPLRYIFYMVDKQYNSDLCTSENIKNQLKLAENLINDNNSRNLLFKKFFNCIKDI